MSNNKTLTLEGPINSTGYGIAATHIYRHLLKKQIGVSCFPAVQYSDHSLLNETEQEVLLRSQETYDPLCPFLKIFHPATLHQRIGKGPYYSFPFFEIDFFTKFETTNLTNCDGLFATSLWAKQILESKTDNKNISIAPLGVDLEIFDYTKYQSENKNKYIFCNIGKWEIRKGHDILLNIFEKAFTKEDDVELWVLASARNVYNPPEEVKKWETVYKTHPLSSKIKIFNEQESQHDVAFLMSQTDCGIYPSRAEGWNLELLETMAMNKPVITTNYSAHTEFCNPDNSYLVDIKSTLPAYDGKFFRNQGNWANIGVEEIDTMVDYMRYVYKNNIKTNKNGVLTGQKFSWSNTVDKIIESVYS